MTGEETRTRRVIQGRRSMVSAMFQPAMVVLIMVRLATLVGVAASSLQPIMPARPSTLVICNNRLITLTPQSHSES